MQYAPISPIHRWSHFVLDAGNEFPPSLYGTPYQHFTKTRFQNHTLQPAPSSLDAYLRLGIHTDLACAPVAHYRRPAEFENPPAFSRPDKGRMARPHTVSLEQDHTSLTSATTTAPQHLREPILQNLLSDQAADDDRRSMRAHAHLYRSGISSPPSHPHLRSMQTRVIRSQSERSSTSWVGLKAPERALWML